MNPHHCEIFQEGPIAQKAASKLKQLVILARWQEAASLMHSLAQLAENIVPAEIIYTLEALTGVCELYDEGLHLLKDVCDSILASADRSNTWLTRAKFHDHIDILHNGVRRLGKLTMQGNSRIRYQATVCLRSIIDLANIWVYQAADPQTGLLLENPATATAILEFVIFPKDFMLFLSSAELLALLHKLELEAKGTQGEQTAVIQLVRTCDPRLLIDPLCEVFKHSNMATLNASLVSLVNAFFDKPEANQLIADVKGWVYLNNGSRSCHLRGQFYLGAYSLLFIEDEALASSPEEITAFEIPYPFVDSISFTDSSPESFNHSVTISDRFILSTWTGKTAGFNSVEIGVHETGSMATALRDRVTSICSVSQQGQREASRSSVLTASKLRSPRTDDTRVSVNDGYLPIMKSMSYEVESQLSSQRSGLATPAVVTPQKVLSDPFQPSVSPLETRSSLMKNSQHDQQRSQPLEVASQIPAATPQHDSKFKIDPQLCDRHNQVGLCTQSSSDTKHRTPSSKTKWSSQKIDQHIATPAHCTITSIKHCRTPESSTKNSIPTEPYQTPAFGILNTNVPNQKLPRPLCIRKTPGFGKPRYSKRVSLIHQLSIDNGISRPDGRSRCTCETFPLSENQRRMTSTLVTIAESNELGNSVEPNVSQIPSEDLSSQQSESAQSSYKHNVWAERIARDSLSGKVKVGNFRTMQSGMYEDVCRLVRTNLNILYAYFRRKLKIRAPPSRIRRT